MAGWPGASWVGGVGNAAWPPPTAQPTCAAKPSNGPRLHHLCLPPCPPCLPACLPRRNADTLKRLQETEKAVREAAQAAYIDLDISGQEKELGNAAFKEQRWVRQRGNCSSEAWPWKPPPHFPRPTSATALPAFP